MAFLATRVLLSCGDDDKDDEPGTGGGNSGTSNSSVNIIDFDGEALVYVDDYDLEYDNYGRLVKIIAGYDHEIKINYNNDKFTIDYEEGQGVGNIQFNKNGYLTGFNFTYEDSYYDDSYGSTVTNSGTQSWEFSYNSSGNLTRLKENVEGTETIRNTKETDHYESTYTFNLTWANNNLVSTSYTETSKSDEYGTETWEGEYNITYGTQTNTFRQIPLLMCDYAISSSFIEVLSAVGMIGVGPKNLPNYIVDSYGDDYNFKYSLNSNGAIAKETVNNYESYVYGYSDFNFDRRSNVAKPKTSGKYSWHGRRHGRNHHNLK